MKPVASLVALLLSFALPTAVIAQPRVIGDLSQGALLGQIQNTAQLQTDFSARHALLADANARLGLTAADFRAVQTAIAQGRARYVEIPRHLDGMAGQYEGHAFAVHNVVIPAHVYGWEVDVTHPYSIVRVFMPNRCGNLSYLRVPRRVVASLPEWQPLPAPPRPVAQVLAAPESIPAPAVAPAPALTPAPVAHIALAPATAAPAAVHHFALLPWLALGLIGIALMHGGGSTSPTAPTVPAAPLPIHTVCPTP